MKSGNSLSIGSYIFPNRFFEEKHKLSEVKGVINRYKPKQHFTSMSNINRREVLMRLSAVLGVAFTEPLMAGVMGKKTYSGPVVAPTAVQEALVAEIADVIIPTTSTPGAK